MRAKIIKVTDEIGSFANMNLLKTIKFRRKKAPTEIYFTEIEEVNLSLKVPKNLV